MPTPPYALADYQVLFNGLIIGGNTQFGILSMDGLGLPDIRSGDVDFPRADGALAGVDYLNSRTLTFSLWVTGGSAGTLQDALLALGTAFQVQRTEQPMQITLPNTPAGVTYGYQLNARPRKGSYSVDGDYAAGVATPVIQMVASDPRLYGSPMQAATTLLQVGGVTYPLTYPFAYTGSAGGNVSVTNSGNYTTSGSMSIRGPVVNPTVTNLTTGQSLSFTITLASTQTLEIDLTARSVLLNGTANRRGTLSPTSSWWQFPPGATDLVFTSDDSPITAATLTVNWSSAWLT